MSNISLNTLLLLYNKKFCYLLSCKLKNIPLPSICVKNILRLDHMSSNAHDLLYLDIWKGSSYSDTLSSHWDPSGCSCLVESFHVPPKLPAGISHCGRLLHSKSSAESTCFFLINHRCLKFDNGKVCIYSTSSNCVIVVAFLAKNAYLRQPAY